MFDHNHYLWLINKGVVLLITVECIHHSLLSEMFYQLLYGYLVIYIFSRNHVKVTCHFIFATLALVFLQFCTGFVFISPLPSIPIHVGARVNAARAHDIYF